MTFKAIFIVLALFSTIIFVPFNSSIEKSNTFMKNSTGEKLFYYNCAACHKMTKKTVGPPLACVEDYRTKEWIYSFVKDADKMVKSGDKDAIKIYQEYNYMQHVKYEDFSESEIDSILMFIQGYCRPVKNSDEIITEISGDKLFEQYCHACHTLDTRTIGPPLGCVEDQRSKDWIFSFVKDADAMVNEGDSLAVKIYHDYNNIPHIKFDKFSQTQMDSILIYLKQNCRR